jgi:predicted TIM-barrel fold metal-dependent hydrolase
MRITRKRNPAPVLEGPAAIGTMALAGMLSFPPIMAEMIVSGLFDRFPKLNVLGIEVEIGWVPFALESMDNFYWRNRTHTGVKLKHLPSDYFRKHFCLSFIIDHHGIKNRHAIGVKNICWSTDYPHHGCDWPYSRKIAGEMLAEVPAEERYQICAGNMVRLYNLPQALKDPY